MSLKSITEPLYLDKTIIGKDIYVSEATASRLSQQQRQGIRFLYRNYKNKNPGVILNDATSCGKKVQVISFLNAIKDLINVNKACLILCSSTNANHWHDQFESWSDFKDVVDLESTVLCVKRKVVIDTFNHAPTANGSKWGIVVIHSDVEPIAKVLKVTKKLQSDFKIWITSEDLKENLTDLGTLYQWIYPNSKFKSSDFVADTKRAVDIIEKKLMLEYFLEDFFLRRDKPDPGFYKEAEEQVRKHEPIKKTSRKNKDPTGTKVKSSKRKKVEETEVKEDSLVTSGSMNDEKSDRVIDNDDGGVSGNYVSYKCDDKELVAKISESLITENLDVKEKEIAIGSESIDEVKLTVKSITSDILDVKEHNMFDSGNDGNADDKGIETEEGIVNNNAKPKDPTFENKDVGDNVGKGDRDEQKPNLFESILLQYF